MRPICSLSHGISRLAAALVALGGLFSARVSPAQSAAAGVPPASAHRIVIWTDANPAPRVSYGIQRLGEALKSVGDEVVLKERSPGVSAAGVIGVGSGTQGPADAIDGRIEVDLASSAMGKALLGGGHIKEVEGGAGKEGFYLASIPTNTTAIVGGDESGVLYGCLELAGRIAKEHGIPANLQFHDKPAFVLRGPCIGMQKTFILPGRHVYEYPYTPELFPFFYDEAFWTRYLDFLADNRMNTLYLWSGHPFASLVRLPDYPYALEVSDEIFRKNEAMFRKIAQEADRRGIWVVQQFYSIILSKPFAEHNHLATQLKASTPIVDDYMRKSVAEFVKQYPNVGLMPCLGEALQGLDNQVNWFTKVILPGVKDGMAEAGLTKEPPVVLRTHATDATVVMPAALKVYSNLYTEEKFNGESLTTWEPRGTRQALHLAMSRLASTHIVNIHILANLEPFRYGDQDFIRKCVLAARDRLGARGVHLYPLSYWNWPYSPDKAAQPLEQIQRDWIWYEAWARYSWNPDVDPAADRTYWLGRIGSMYGDAAAADILGAYDDSGECAPRILRRFGITEGNRQTMSLGMTLEELTDPDKYNAFTELWESQSPPGERLQEYADREWAHLPHEGETPPGILAEVRDYSARAVKEADAAEPLVTSNREEFERLRNDVHCIREMSLNYAAKVEAAMLVLRYRHSHDVADMDRASERLAESLEHYRALARLTADTYNYANSMQTKQRRIPLPGGTGTKAAYYHWTQLVPNYERELADFRTTVAKLHSASAGAPGAGTGSPAAGGGGGAVSPLKPVPFRVVGAGAESYRVEAGARIFTDSPEVLGRVSPALAGMTGIRVSREATRSTQHSTVEIEVAAPARVLVGYVRSGEQGWLHVPNLETDADAVDLVGSEVLVENAASVAGLPAIDVHAWNVPAGRHVLDLRGGGSFLILGVVSAAPAP